MLVLVVFISGLCMCNSCRIGRNCTVCGSRTLCLFINWPTYL